MMLKKSPWWCCLLCGCWAASLAGLAWNAHPVQAAVSPCSRIAAAEPVAETPSAGGAFPVAFRKDTVLAPVTPPASPRRPPEPARPSAITAAIQFRVVSSTDFRALAGARVVVIGPDGRMLHTGLTDAEGFCRVSVSVPQDPRFPDLAFVTALCVADGHNETVVFDVPVREGTVQPVTLNPIQPGLRNEPSAMLGQIHRLEVIDFVNRYGAALGLQRQTPIPGEQGYAPFGPKLGR